MEGTAAVGIVLKAGTGTAVRTEEAEGIVGAVGIDLKAGIAVAGTAGVEAGTAGAEGTGSQAEHTEAEEGTEKAGSCLQAA